MFRLQNKPRPGGPLTFGLDKAIAPTTTISSYKPSTTLAGDDSWKEFNEISGPIDASFVAITSSTPLSTPLSIAASISSTSLSEVRPQSTASTPSPPSAAPPSSSETGTSSSTGQDSSPEKGGLTTGAKAGIGAGGAVAVIAIAVLAFLLWRQRRRRSTAATAASNTAGVERGGREEVQEKEAAYFSPELGGETKFYGNELDGRNVAGIKEQPHDLGIGTKRYELGDGGQGGWQGRTELP